MRRVFLFVHTLSLASLASFAVGKYFSEDRKSVKEPLINSLSLRERVRVRGGGAESRAVSLTPTPHPEGEGK